jgi:predicted secreted protein
MKNKLLLISMVIAFTGFATSCKKTQNNPAIPMVEINAQDNGKTITVLPGQALKITLSNPGDGGYVFDAPQYNSSVLTLAEHTHTPSTTNAVGDAGTDSWKFDVHNLGSTALTITATRSFEKNSPIVIFNGNLVIK